MLGKQEWKVASDQDAIISQVFKAKYYTNGEFLGSSMGHNLSYTWCSIHTSHAFVKDGIRWRLGDGQKIKIWSNPWFCDPQNSYIVSPPIDGLLDLTVSSLIHPTTKIWKETLIHDLFVPFDATRILSMPIYSSHDHDEILWKLSKDDTFSVKSTYYHAMDNMIDSSHLHVSGNWKSLWSLKISRKMIVFLWRVARGCLPTSCSFCMDW